MSGFVIVVGLFLAVSLVVGTVRATVGRVGAGGLRVAAGVVALLVLALTAVLSSVQYVGENYIGIVIKNVGMNDLPQGQILATAGEKGPQAKILGPGWRPGLWPIVFDVEKTPVVEIDDDQVGLLTTTDGRPLPTGQIYAPQWTEQEFQRMLDADYFLGDGQGYKGPQTSVLTPGKYRLNTKLFNVEKVLVTNVKKTTVGVIKSNVGMPSPDVAATPDALVEQGQRGIWRQPRLPQKYYLNTKAYEVTMISTAKRVVQYAGSQRDGEQREITVRTSDGFDFPVDVRVEFEVTPQNAPLVVASFGDDGNDMLERLNSAVRAIFRNNAETVKALDYVNQRSLQETQSLMMLATEMTKVGVSVTAVRIAGVAEDGSLDTLLKTQTDRQIADEEVKTFKQQQLAAEQRKELTRTEQEAEEERRLATATYEVQIAEQQKERRIIEAGAEAAAIRIRAEAQAEAYRVVAEQIGPGNAALLELLKIVGEAGINITPRVMVSGKSNSSGQSSETTALIGTMLDTMLSRAEPIAKKK
ncbi:MAG: hypothetical protein IH888_05225 [Planctomycetes bacterium]|nr:hypothetical protein [Planctomycetota bacterium]